MTKYPNLLAEMKKAKDTQYTLAKILHISQPSVHRKLAGITKWNIGEVELLCEHFNKDYYQLFK